MFELDLGDYLAQIFSNCAEQTLWSLCKEHENGEGGKGSHMGVEEGCSPALPYPERNYVEKAFSRASECKNLFFKINGEIKVD